MFVFGGLDSQIARGCGIFAIDMGKGGERIDETVAGLAGGKQPLTYIGGAGVWVALG